MITPFVGDNNTDSKSDRIKMEVRALPEDSSLTSKYRHTLDVKNRMFIPAKYREILGKKFVITKSVFDKCLLIYPLDEWKSYTEKIKGIPASKATRIRRLMFSSALQVEPDSQGRVQIPEELKQFAGIDRNVLILGCDDYAEIWSEEMGNAIESDEITEDDLRAMGEAGM